MRRHSLLSIVSILALVAAPASVGLAQPTPRLADPADDIDVDEDEDWDEEDEDWDEEDEDWGDEEEEDEEPAARPPLADPGDAPEEEPLDEPEPGDDQSLLDSAAPASDPTRAAWTSPQSVLTLHGYLRVRGELQDNFFLDHRNTWPFSLWVPGSSEADVAGGCSGDPATAAPCGRSDRLRYANMRVRLQPTLALSDDVRVHMTIDVLDNAVLGSSPDRVVDGSIPAAGGGVHPVDGAPIDFGSMGASSTSRGDAFRDSIYVRRAWAEVTNRALGQLRFGRMAHEWGLGMLYNAGDNLDGDYSSEVDRIQAITRYSNLFFGASYDFAGEGVVMSPLTNLRAVPFDFTGADDIRQFSFLAAYRMSEEEQEERLANGDWVLNAGLYFLYRKQRLSSEDSPLTGGPTLDGLVRRNARQVTPDVWLQFLWGDLRLELEGAMHIGSIRNIQNGDFDDDDYRILSFGFALQAEYRLLDEALGIYLDTGLATGDSQARGISNRENTYQQQDDNRQLTHFNFHPNYRIDLILFRNVLGNIGGVYYLRPGISYDLVRTAFGQRVGARVDMIYSRANRTSQIRNYGDRDNNNLGLELDASVYYRSEDGPGLTDGFYAAFQYGILFPLAGLKESGLSVGNAQTLRLILGVEY